jgi:hypothetical protein
LAYCTSLGMMGNDERGAVGGMIGRRN